VPRGKTVFLDPYTLKPYTDQWTFLESVKCVDEHLLDNIIEINDLSAVPAKPKVTKRDLMNNDTNKFGLPICAQKMLQEGVSQFQRVSCFRLAVHLKKLGLPFDITTAALETWAGKNRPNNGKKIISQREIIEQTKYVFNNNYSGYGCNSEAVSSFCNSNCPVRLQKNNILF
jgi:hypothetical protein